MNLPLESAPPSPFFHDASGAVRFWVRTEAGGVVGAMITKEVLHFRFRGDRSGVDALATYLAHCDEIDAAVRRRLDKGSIEPVMLREADITAVQRS